MFPERVVAARIEVERIDEPVLVIGGGQDTVWASADMSDTIKQARDAAGLQTESYVYPAAGHGVGGSPIARSSRADLEARLENFPATMAFLKRHSDRADCRSEGSENR